MYVRFVRQETPLSGHLLCRGTPTIKGNTLPGTTNAQAPALLTLVLMPRQPTLIYLI